MLERVIDMIGKRDYDFNHDGRIDDFEKRVLQFYREGKLTMPNKSGNEEF